MIEGKVAIVTGGTRGIGLETVRTFLKNGAKVALLGSREETVNKAVEELKNENEKYDVIGFYPCLHKESELCETFNEIKSAYGKIDIVVNNAGMSSSTPLTNYTEEEYDKIANLNIKSVFMVSKVAVPYLEETKGVIINTSSMVSIYGQPAGVMYPASKFAVNGMTKSLARELAPKGIRVNAVAPGITETDMVAALPKEVIEPLIKTIPLGRIGTPQDIANGILFLASDMASYVTGEILSIDGAARS
ncbi:MAG: glucose 1-dehydrogenase [Firmicutes bacterium]|nr:glucose 1-dehydrogenase [Bacillota bacterium]